MEGVEKSAIKSQSEAESAWKGYWAQTQVRKTGSISVYAPLPQLPLFNCLLTHLFWNLLSSVSSSTGLRLTLPRQIGEILVVCKGQREPVAMQGVEEGLGEGKWVDWALK